MTADNKERGDKARGIIQKVREADNKDVLSKTQFRENMQWVRSGQDDWLSWQKIEDSHEALRAKLETAEAALNRIAEGDLTDDTFNSDQMAWLAKEIKAMKQVAINAIEKEE